MHITHVWPVVEMGFKRKSRRYIPMHQSSRFGRLTELKRLKKKGNRYDQNSRL